jgi:site-specific DNA recombinase
MVAGFHAVLAGMPLARIATQWNDKELFTPQVRRDGSPSPWTAQTIRSTLLNPRYAGLRSHVTAAMLEAMDPRVARIQGIVGPAAWPALIAEETWRAVVEILTDPSRAKLPRSARGLLTGVALCGVCGATVHRGGSPSSTTSRNRYATYRCSAALGHIGRAADPVDDYIGRVVVARLQQPDAARLLVDEQHPDAGELRTEAAALRSRLDSLAGLLADGVLTEAAVRREATRLRVKLDAVQQEQASAGRVNALAPLITADDAGAVWESLDVSQRRAVVEMLMTVTLLPPGRGVRTFRPQTVVVTWAG